LATLGAGEPPSSTGSNTTSGWSFSRTILAFTSMPIFTASGAMPSTRAIMRGPSARSISARL